VTRQVLPLTPLEPRRRELGKRNRPLAARGWTCPDILSGHESRSSICPVDIFFAICLYWSRLFDQRYTAKVVIWLDVWDLTAPVERLKGRELQVSTRTPLLSLSNSPTRRANPST
jgi:hypothetical protein